ncbi:hypothetical protein HIM_12366 [Hirsutella minnesotensis 3608]|uniref:BED-type domain-containing protein n=1 Tax=Hirsutella minnesotensis 3608 TaxID=1043627 RepID=A0A0F7ZW28_9HYPO|nr:hypothetical protein HIM_12366 [Hirsutella minnesotensis 3608]
MSLRPSVDSSDGDTEAAVTTLQPVSGLTTSSPLPSRELSASKDPASQLAHEEHHQRTLWSHFPGWLFSERVRETRCWAWQFGYDIQRKGDRRWVCQACIRKNAPRPRNFEADGIHNAYNHLYNDHGIGAPPGKTQGPAEKRTSKRSRPVGQKTLAESMKLDLHDPREQAIANCFIKRFDKEYFRRLLVNWIVAKNHSFSIAEETELHAIFEYLNPSVSGRKANMTHTTVRKKIIVAFEEHREKVIDVLRKAPGQTMTRPWRLLVESWDLLAKPDEGAASDIS